MNNSPAGLLLLDKSPGYTSHQVVATIRKILKNELKADIKVGHLGTLDPFASGLLPILIGGVTRLTDEMMSGKKQYLFQIKLGIETDTLDTAGQVIKTADVPNDYLDKIKIILSQFQGEIDQIPPVYSALKMQGRPLYEYMRASGKLPSDIETKKRKVYIENIEIIEDDFLTEKENNFVTLRVLCGKGTYVRSLARDISYAIGTVGHCYSLRREYVEPWHVENALLFSKDSQPTFDDIFKHMIFPQQILPHIPSFSIPEIFTKLFSAGNVVTLSGEYVANINWVELKDAKACFAKSVLEHVMYYCSLEIGENEYIKIKPNKKMY